MATRKQLTSQPRSGVTAGATRGGIGAGHGQPATGPQPAAASTAAPAPSTTPAATVPMPAASSSGASSSSSGASSSKAAAPKSSTTAAGPVKSTSRVTEQGAGLLVALFAWPIGVNLLKGGPSQMWGWIKAKFINEPYAGPGGSAPGAAAPGVQPGRRPNAAPHQRAGVVPGKGR